MAKNTGNTGTTFSMSPVTRRKKTINDWTGLGGKSSLEVIAKLFRIVYVAGPMTGYENFNFPAFDEGRDYINQFASIRNDIELPLAAVSPADMDRAHGFDEAEASKHPQGAVVSPTFFFDCMRRDIELVSRSFAIILLKGWKASKGANIELFVARMCGVHVWLAQYDSDGALDGHVEAPEWLRSPLIYGDDGNPAHEEIQARRELAEATLAKNEEAIVQNEIDQTLSEVPEIAPPLTKSGSYKITSASSLRPEGPTILEEANGLIYGDRNKSYGHPIDDFSRTGKMWAGVLRDWALTVIDKNNVPDVPPELVGLCQVQVKVSREVNAHKRDNLVDIGGYAGTVQMCADFREEHPTCDFCGGQGHVQEAHAYHTASADELRPV
jgi:hypothetical protein